MIYKDLHANNIGDQDKIRVLSARLALQNVAGPVISKGAKVDWSEYWDAKWKDFYLALAGAAVVMVGVAVYYLVLWIKGERRK